tara:strand:+ start:219 stop:491 length:273 start_codon:yes stop_codon:yes gene_type:complete
MLPEIIICFIYAVMFGTIANYKIKIEMLERKVNFYRSKALKNRIHWIEIYQDLVGKPMKARSYKDAMRLLSMVQSIMDGEPTTTKSLKND